MAVAWQLQGPSATYTIPAGDEPLADSRLPEEQEDIHAEFTPLGASNSDATIIQYLGSLSKGAEGGEAFELHFWCTTATRTELRSRKRTTFTIRDALNQTHSVYLKRIRSSWIGQPIDQTGARVHVWATFLGR